MFCFNDISRESFEESEEKFAFIIARIQRHCSALRIKRQRFNPDGGRWTEWMQYYERH